MCAGGGGGPMSGQGGRGVDSTDDSAARGGGWRGQVGLSVQGGLVCPSTPVSHGTYLALSSSHHQPFALNSCCFCTSTVVLPSPPRHAFAPPFPSPFVTRDPWVSGPENPACGAASSSSNRVPIVCLEWTLAARSIGGGREKGKGRRPMQTAGGSLWVKSGCCHPFRPLPHGAHPALSSSHHQPISNPEQPNCEAPLSPNRLYHLSFVLICTLVDRGGRGGVIG